MFVHDEITEITGQVPDAALQMFKRLGIIAYGAGETGMSNVR